MIWAKFLHVAAIAIWSAGLIALPGLYVQRARVPDAESLHRLQAMVRFMYVALVSPAAFVAIGSGTALIFLRGTFEPWFTAKLVFVGVMVLIHVVTGLVIIRLFEKGNVYPLWRFVTVTVLSLAAVSAVLLFVLGKPDLPDMVPAVMREPGGLRLLLGDLIAFPL